MKFRNLLIFILMLIINPFVGSFSQVNRKTPPNGSPLPKINISKPEIFVLKNGLTVIFLEDHRFPIIDLSLTLDQDFLLQKDKTGIKNIFGEMLRAGTKKHTKEEFDKEIDQMGTSLFSSFSEFYLSSLKRYFVPSLALMSEMILEPSFDNIKEYQKLIKRSIADIKINEKNPTFILSRVRNKLYYGVNHPYGEFSTLESLSNIELKDFKTFYKKYFLPEKAYLTFVGDITKEEVYKLSNQYFSKWNNKSLISKKKYKIPNFTSEIEIDMVDLPSSTQALISVGNPVDFKKSFTDFFSANLANKILGGGSQGHLFLNLREDKGYTYGAYSNLLPDKNIGSFEAITQVRNEVAVFAIKELLKEIKKIKKTIKENELTSFKNEISGNFILSLENPKNSIRFVLEELIKLVPKDFYKNYLKNLQNVTKFEVIKSAKKYIPNHLRVIVIGDLKKIKPLIKKLGYPIRLFDKSGNLI